MKRTDTLRHERITENARAITNTKKAKARKKRIIISTVAIALVSVTAVSFLVFGAINGGLKAIGTDPAAAIGIISTNTTAANSGKTSTESAQTASAQTASVQTSAQQNTDRIDNINGERVYIDTKRQAPAVTGTPLHYYANGKTSYGFDWNYNTDNSCFLLRCDYNFNQQQYDFQFYGVTPGTAHVTLYYNTDDNTQVPVSMTVVVDDALNVTTA